MTGEPSTWHVREETAREKSARGEQEAKDLKEADAREEAQAAKRLKGPQPWEVRA